MSQPVKDDPNEPVPMMQQLLDNPFLLLFLGRADADGRLYAVGRDRHPDHTGGQVDRSRAATTTKDEP